MNELTKRTIFGLLYLAVFLGSLWLSDIAFAIVLVFIAAAGTAEMLKLTIPDIGKGMLCGITATLVLLFTATPVIDMFHIDPYALSVTSVCIAVIVLPFILSLFSTRHGFQQISSGIWASAFFVLLPVAMMMHAVLIMSNGNEAVTLIFAIVCLNDVFAYLVGKAIGKHKLFERISPAKTIEGCVGGVVLSVLSVFLFNRFGYTFAGNREVIAFAFAVAVLGIFGDLIESMLKRQAGVKDSGKVIPGHGGILDRLDSLFFALPIGLLVFHTLIR